MIETDAIEMDILFQEVLSFPELYTAVTITCEGIPITPHTYSLLFTILPDISNDFE